MRSSALRAEFVLSGTALLLAVYAAWLAVRRLGGESAIPVNEWLSFNPLGSTAKAVVFAALFIGAASCVGALLVQLTFEIPGRYLIWRAQRRALEQLERTAAHQRVVGRGEDGGQIGRLLPTARDLPKPASALARLLEPVRRVVRRKVRSQVEDSPDEKRLAEDAMATVLAVGWVRMSPEAAREVEYRRSNRQVFLGVVPGVIVGATAACIALLRGHGATVTVVSVIAVVVVTIVGVCLAYTGAQYQEQRIAALLLTAALVQEDQDGRVRFLPRARQAPDRVAQDGTAGEVSGHDGAGQVSSTRSSQSAASASQTAR